MAQRTTKRSTTTAARQRPNSDAQALRDLQCTISKVDDDDARRPEAAALRERLRMALESHAKGDDRSHLTEAHRLLGLVVESEQRSFGCDPEQHLFAIADVVDELAALVRELLAVEVAQETRRARA